MTTENGTIQQLPDRDIGQLLALGTYQGMTDSEIDSIIDFKVRIALTDSKNLAVMNAQMDVANEMVRLAQDSADHSREVLDTLLAGSLLLRKVEENVS